ncbi:MAG: GGDEF domain-containing protein [Clostridia bacterium]|nr:GGDEF domain-containing protein [Clostridia bacterium]
MRSIKTKITLMTILVLAITVIIVTTSTVLFIRATEVRKADQILLLLCETGERNLDYYFNSVQRSVRKVGNAAEANINGIDDENLARHVEYMRDYFDVAASKTNGVLTYYYRIDPTVSTTVKGFWYENKDDDFVEREVTNLADPKYDLSSTADPGLVWFTVPKLKGEAIWLPPYESENLYKKVISYNIPIYWRGTFVGVVGIEIDYSTMAEQVDSIRLYDHGYAFLNDENGDLFYHPRIDVSQLTEENKPIVPDGALSESTFIKYTFEGVERIAAWLPLSNGMRINVSVPVSETEGDWRGLVVNILVVAGIVLAAAVVNMLFFTGRIVKPIKQLTEAAEKVDSENYDFTLDYDKGDELGNLTRTFKRLTVHMKDHISSLNKQVFVDALTRVKNKGAFSIVIDEIQDQINTGTEPVKFAVGVFDCDGLKMINDRFGHEKGDIYLKSASRAICKAFQHSPVFRIGGDEFSVVLRSKDYHDMDYLIKQFERDVEETNRSTDKQWEQVRVSMGIAVYDPQNDDAVIDVVRRADKNMYENKRTRKNAGSAPSQTNKPEEKDE